VRVTGIERPGSCRIRFPNLDCDAWQRWSPASSSAPTEIQGRPPAVRDDTPVPAGAEAPGRGRWHRVLQGECLASIARDAGHFVATLWNHTQNAELRRRRGDPHILLPGDAVFVPEKRPREESGAIDQHHKFRRRGEPAALRLRLLMPSAPTATSRTDSTEQTDGRCEQPARRSAEDRPWANVPYRLEVDDQTWPGTTDTNGRIVQRIPGNARRGRLVVSPGTPEQVEYMLRLGHLCPSTSIRGVKGRLANLGFPAGSDDNDETSELATALRMFQAKHNLPATGRLDETTRQRIEQAHGS
jgi:N-acetylmuramoyl-L-alanine amidase